MNRCLLLTGGPLADCNAVSLDGWRDPDTLVIACDAGLRVAAHYQVSPALAVGDFDSFAGALPPGIRVLRSSAQKDETDTMLGLQTALERGCRDFLLVGALGGRLDHTVANLQTLAWLTAQGARAELRANYTRVWAVENDTLTLSATGIRDWYLSVFAWGKTCHGVFLEGLEYPLSDAVLTCACPVGVSNRFSGDTARITVRDGLLVVMAVQERLSGTEEKKI